MENKKTAILVVDMLNDFVTGALQCDRGLAIVPNVQRLLRGARETGVTVVFCNDSHLKGIDHEFKIWGEHAVRGTYGAQVIDELELCDKDYVVDKRRYSGFFHTDLDLLLTELGIDTVIMTGLHAHMCVRHTTADAYQLGYNVIVASDATDSFTEEDYVAGIKYLKEVYGARIATVDQLVEEFRG
ncbi:MAG: cysteine hydrolase [Clostridia bacterium]|nr:cysteine hydrolase [Clostridia bacterium]